MKRAGHPDSLRILMRFSLSDNLGIIFQTLISPLFRYTSEEFDSSRSERECWMHVNIDRTCTASKREWSLMAW